MAWLSTNSENEGVAGSDSSWLEDDDAPPVDPVESLRRRMETLGQNEGLERGLKVGEERGFVTGFKEEAPRAFMLGRVLGAAKGVIACSSKCEELTRYVTQAEQAAAEHWVSNPRLVDDKLSQVQPEMVRLGVSLPEWPKN